MAAFSGHRGHGRYPTVTMQRGRMSYNSRSVSEDQPCIGHTIAGGSGRRSFLRHTLGLTGSVSPGRGRSGRKASPNPKA